MSVVAIFLNSVRSDNTLQVVVLEEPLYSKIAEGHAAASEAVELEGAGQQAIQLLINKPQPRPDNSDDVPYQTM